MGGGVTARMGPSEPIKSPKRCPLQVEGGKNAIAPQEIIDLTVQSEGKATCESTAPAPNRGHHLVPPLEVENGAWGRGCFSGSLITSDITTDFTPEWHPYCVRRLRLRRC